MTDPITSSLPPASRQPKMATTENKVSATRQDNNAPVEANASTKTAETADNVKLSALTEQALQNAEFDQEKTARIKQAIEQGNYPLDHKRVAESFLSLELLIGSRS